MEDEIIKIGRSYIKEDFVGYGEDLGFYFKYNGKLLSNFEYVNKILNFIDFKKYVFEIKNIF